MDNTLTADAAVIVWRTVDSVTPPAKKLLMVTGDSRYRTHTRFLTLAYYDENYRPSRDGSIRWLNVQNDELSDLGWEPTHWAEPIGLPN